MSGTAGETFADDPAELQHYVEALLSEPATSAARGYWLVPAAGVQLALPEDEVVACEAARAPGAASGEEHELIDVTRLVTGRSAEGERRRFRLPGFPRYRLEVEVPSGTIRRRDDEIRWRPSASVRPWLAGMIAAPAAAVLSVEKLVEEHRRCAGESRGD